MAVPKRKTSPMQRGFRDCADPLKAPAYVEAKNSGELRRPHHVDLKTGMYRGRQIFTPKTKETGHEGPLLREARLLRKQLAELEKLAENHAKANDRNAPHQGAQGGGAGPSHSADCRLPDAHRPQPRLDLAARACATGCGRRDRRARTRSQAYGLAAQSSAGGAAAKEAAEAEVRAARDRFKALAEE